VPTPVVVQAAGGVLWRPAGAGIEVAVVHRPRYDDWSLPKGKLATGEHALAAAVREVREETGYAATVGRTLGRSDYLVLEAGTAVPKMVRWWAMRAGTGTFVAGDEVDELRWLPPAAAQALLTAGRDVKPLRLLVEAGLATTTVLLVRHGRAGRRESWPGDDLQRPLDARGHEQARRLAELLPAYGPLRVLSAPALRCVQTVAPLAGALGVQVQLEAAVGEQAYDLDPHRALALVCALGAATGTTVLCSQGGAVPGLVRALTGGAGMELTTVRARKGSVWALTFTAGRLVDADHLAPLA